MHINLDIKGTPNRWISDAGFVLKLFRHCKMWGKSGKENLKSFGNKGKCKGGVRPKNSAS